MTTIVANAAFNMNAVDLVGSINYDFVSLNSAAAIFFDDANNYQAFSGFGLDYNAFGEPISGTITGAETVENGATIYQYSDFSILAVTLYSLIIDNDFQTLFDTILAGNDSISGSAFKDVIQGNDGDDIVNGNGGNDVIFGGIGTDTLSGGDFNDRLYGNSGADLLDGQNGLDTLTGGGGPDTFQFSTKLKAKNIDTVTDFSVADDTINLSSAIFTKAGAIGELNSWRFATGPQAADGLDRIIYNDATGALYYDSDGDGAAAAVQFAQLSTGLALTSADFQIV